MQNQEHVDAKEQANTIELVRLNVESADPKPGEAKRGQHAKHHGCVKATFTIADDIPDDLRRGIFSKQQSFDALIRFSNGRKSDDREPDAHGMAIKLLNVPGSKLLEGRETETAHDFVLVDHEVFFTGDSSEYLDFNREAFKARRSKFHGILFLGKMKLFHSKLLSRAKDFAGQTPSSPLTSQYWSTTPYCLGDQVVKYLAKPLSIGSIAADAGVTSENGLSDSLVSRLANEGVAFDFGADVQTDPSLQPIEDPTVNWSEKGARFERLARIDIPKQTVDPKSALAENLVFSPWHALEEHRPLGGINRARKPVYREMAKRRHEVNAVTPAGTSEIPSA